MSCGRGCDVNWDVRCCCEYNCPSKNSNLQFKKCNMKINTIFFKLGNDEDLYNWACSDKFHLIKEYYDLTNDEIIEIRNLWLERIEEY